MSSTKFLISIILVALAVQASAAGNRRLLNIPGFQLPPYMNIPNPVLLPPLLPSPTNIPPVVFPSTPPSDPTNIPVPVVFPSTPPSNPTLPNVPTVFPPPSIIATP